MYSLNFNKSSNKSSFFSQQEAAAKFAQAFPRSRGFFQELRNAVPQMIFAGELDLSFSILASFKPPNLADQVNNCRNEKDIKNLFVLYFFMPTKPQ